MSGLYGECLVFWSLYMNLVVVVVVVLVVVVVVVVVVVEVVVVEVLGVLVVIHEFGSLSCDECSPQKG